MKRLLVIIFFALLLSINASSQSIDSLLLKDNEIPKNYSLTKENNCISIQACILYKNPEMYGVLIGKLKTKKIQNFDNEIDKGSIMYFEFEDGFKGEGFLGGLLWGGDKPTSEHPEEYYAKGKYLIVWSFKQGSIITKTSKDKIIEMLK